MRKYLIFIFAAILFIGFSLPLVSEAAIADGTYTLQYQVNKPGSSSASMANDYFLKPATLIVKNGNMIMQLTINKSGWVTQFNPPGGAKVITTNEAANQRTVQFSVSNASLTTIGMKIDIEDIDYHHAYSVDFVFNTEGLPEAKVEEPKQQTPEQQAQQTTQQQAQTNPQTNTTKQTQSSGSNTSSNKPATSSEKESTESYSQTITTTSTDDSTISDEQASSTDEQKAEDSEAVENPETSDELPILALLLLIVAMIVFIRTKQTKTIK